MNYLSRRVARLERVDRLMRLRSSRDEWEAMTDADLDREIADLERKLFGDDVAAAEEFRKSTLPAVRQMHSV